LNAQILKSVSSVTDSMSPFILPMSWRRIASSASLASKSFFKRLLNMQGIQSI